jgi:3-dehydroquinate dehydratase
VNEAIDLVKEGNSSNADMLELRLDFYKDFNVKEHLKPLMTACERPFIVTYRPAWEGSVTDPLRQMPFIACRQKPHPVPTQPAYKTKSD